MTVIYMTTIRNRYTFVEVKTELFYDQNVNKIGVISAGQRNYLYYIIKCKK